MISVCHAAFMGIGAYVTTILMGPISGAFDNLPLVVILALRSVLFRRGVPAG